MLQLVEIHYNLHNVGHEQGDDLPPYESRDKSSKPTAAKWCPVLLAKKKTCRMKGSSSIKLTAIQKIRK